MRANRKKLLQHSIKDEIYLAKKPPTALERFQIKAFVEHFSSCRCHQEKELNINL